MDEKERVEKDIAMFEENIRVAKEINLCEEDKKILELAEQYFNDAKYYLEKKDLFTAFGCINYAHGLLDSLIKRRWRGEL